MSFGLVARHWCTRNLQRSVCTHNTFVSCVPGRFLESRRYRASGPFSRYSSRQSARYSSGRHCVVTMSAVQEAVSAKLGGLRNVMKGLGVDAFIIPSEDPHMSEYPPDCHARREFISGFDGSAGTAVVTHDVAALWTDGRYFLQAGEQLSSEWTLMKAGTPGVPDVRSLIVE